MMQEAVRLIIWDLDETFWQGTLTEGGIKAFIQDNHKLVKDLAERGIMSSICSKNDFEPVKSILVEQGIWDYFIFPSIDWTPKSHRVKEIIEAVQLRPATVLFIDDNPGNRGEVEALVPGIQTADEHYPRQISDDPLFKGKDDRSLSRLNQYKLLEKRWLDQKNAGGDNRDFLRSSNIRVIFEHDVTGQLDRVVELINRTNQLNYTKRRLPEDPEAARAEILAELAEFNIRAGLIRVVDDYGDYGFVGFFLVRRNRLQHYCFSCRTLGMYVEAWVYDWLGRPELNVVGEVLTDLSVDQGVDWIEARDAASVSTLDEQPRAKLPSVRLRGGCDLDSVAHYFRLHTDDHRTELMFTRNGMSVRLDHSLLLYNALRGATAAEIASVAPVGFADEDFRTTMFSDAPPGTVWVFSGWGDPKMGVYRHRQTGLEVPFNVPGIPANFAALDDERLETLLQPLRLSADRADAIRMAVRHLRREFDFRGPLKGERFKAVRRAIFDAIPADGHMFVVLGNETGRNAAGDTVVRDNVAHNNRLTRELCQERGNVTAVDLEPLFAAGLERPAGDHLERAHYHALFRHLLDQSHAVQPGTRLAGVAAE